jgi:IS5 family transposase
VDARWREEDQKTVRGTVFPTINHGKSHYGYKNHINVDRTHKLVRRYHVTDAAVHDNRVDRQRAEDRDHDADRLERIEADIRAMRDLMFEAFERCRTD